MRSYLVILSLLSKQTRPLLTSKCKRKVLLPSFCTPRELKMLNLERLSLFWQRTKKILLLLPITPVKLHQLMLQFNKPPLLSKNKHKHKLPLLLFNLLPHQMVESLPVLLQRKQPLRKELIFPRSEDLVLIIESLRLMFLNSNPLLLQLNKLHQLLLRSLLLKYSNKLTCLLLYFKIMRIQIFAKLLPKDLLNQNRISLTIT